eukprot:2267029-Rhodomonas_salina.1
MEVKHDGTLDAEFMYHFRNTRVKDDPGDVGRRISKADALEGGLLDPEPDIPPDEVFSCQLEKELYDGMVINRVSGAQGADLLKIIKSS